MRTIKFRAWIINEHRMIKWHPDFFSDSSIVTGNSSDFPYDEETVILMQYTGLKDKNGKEIYEGDIVSPNNREVLWANDGEGALGAGFYTKCHSSQYGDSLWSFGITQAECSEVIGTIHDNPEMAN